MVGFLFLSINENNFEVSFEMSFLFFLICEGRNLYSPCIFYI
jgi:hypothetical protein